MVLSQNKPIVKLILRVVMKKKEWRGKKEKVSSAEYGKTLSGRDELGGG